jgi:RNA recognition motif-containing protein
MHDQQRSDRRSRSGSRHRSNRGGRRDFSSRESVPTRPQPPVKLTFWQKLASIFTGKPKAAAAAPRQAAPQQNRQAPQQNGHRRFESTPSSTPAPTRTARKPEVVEVSSPKIYVGNLSFDATEGDLFELFNGVGKVQNAEVVSNKYTHKSKGFAFVTMTSVDEARRAVTELHDKQFMGRKLVVSGAKTSDTRDGGSRQPQEHHDEREESSAPTAP